MAVAGFVLRSLFRHEICYWGIERQSEEKSCFSFHLKHIEREKIMGRELKKWRGKEESKNWYGQLGQAEKYGIIKMELMGPHRMLQVPFFSVVRCLRFSVHGDGWVDGWDVTWAKNIPCSCRFIGHKKPRSRISTHFFCSYCCVLHCAIMCMCVKGFIRDGRNCTTWEKKKMALF